MTTHAPDHSFLPDANVLLLFDKNKHKVGKGTVVVNEKAVQELYRIENQIIQLASLDKTVCVPL